MDVHADAEFAEVLDVGGHQLAHVDAVQPCAGTESHHAGQVAASSLGGLDEADPGDGGQLDGGVAGLDGMVTDGGQPRRHIGAGIGAPRQSQQATPPLGSQVVAHLGHVDTDELVDERGRQHRLNGERYPSREGVPRDLGQVGAVLADALLTGQGGRLDRGPEERPDQLHRPTTAVRWLVVLDDSSQIRRQVAELRLGLDLGSRASDCCLAGPFGSSRVGHASLRCPVARPSRAIGGDRAGGLSGGSRRSGLAS